MDLVPVLQRALLLQQQYQSKPCHPGIPSYIRYVQDLLFREDEEDQEIQRNHSTSCSLLVQELSSLIAPSQLVPLKLGSSDFRSLLLEGARAVVTRDASRVHQVVGMVQTVARETRLAVTQGSLSERSSPSEVVYLHFADALVAKLSGTGPQLCRALRTAAAKTDVSSVVARGHAATSMRLLCREMILLKCRTAKRIHIVDLGTNGGYQWPCLIHALAHRRSHKLDYLKITGVDYPKPILKVKLKEYAESLGLTFYWEPISCSSWDRVNIATDPTEVLIVCCAMKLMYLPNPNAVLERIFKLQPLMFLQCEFSSIVDNPFFLPRFEAALKHYEACYTAAVDWPKLSGTIQLRIMDLIACEGAERQDRRTTYKCWDERARRAGFECMQVPQYTIDRITASVRDSQRRCDVVWPIVMLNGQTLCGLFAWQPARSL